MVAKPVRQEFPFDPVVCLVVSLIVLTGLVMVASASVELSSRTYGNSAYLLSRHGVYLGAASVGALITLSLPVSFWQKVHIPMLAAGILLLMLVLVPGIGKEVNGSVRWISLGLFTIQGSELLKFIIVVFLAGYLVRTDGLREADWLAVLKPLGVVSFLVLLLMMQPDFGASAVIVATALSMIFLAGAPLRYLLPLAGGVVTVGSLLVVLQPYRLARWTAFTDPWEHQYEGGYQLTQALIAFGRGDLFGLGLGNSIQKLFFLPEAHTDFLFSILAEELGVVAAALIISLFCVLVLRGLWIAMQAKRQEEPLHAYLAYGASLILGIQACINIGVNLGVLPTKGLTLPLMSYGGNSLIVSFALIALLLRVEYELRAKTAAAPRRRSRGS